jgi:hypothetical protein
MGAVRKVAVEDVEGLEHTVVRAGPRLPPGDVRERLVVLGLGDDLEVWAPDELGDLGARQAEPACARVRVDAGGADVVELELTGIVGHGDLGGLGRCIPSRWRETPGAGGRRYRDGDGTNAVGRRRRTSVRRDGLVWSAVMTHVAHVTTGVGKNKSRLRTLRISVAKNRVPARTKRVFRAPAKCEVEQ